MKVSNSKDSAELQNVHRSNKSKRAEAVDTKQANSLKGSDKSDEAATIAISKDAKLLAKGIEAAKNADVSDKEKIARIKEKIQKGTYEPDFGAVAERMLDEHIDN